jgi:hypothetical protein
MPGEENDGMVSYGELWGVLPKSGVRDAGQIGERRLRAAVSIDFSPAKAEDRCTLIRRH